MKHTVPALALLAVAAAAYAQNDPVKAAEKQIEAQYQTNVIDAYRRHDLDRFAKAFTADVAIKGVDGKTRNLKQHLARVKQDMANTVTIRSAHTQFHASTLKGDTLISDASEVWDSDFRDVQGVYGPKGKTYATIWRCRGTYVHVKTADGWRLKRAEIKGETLTSGGKPLAPLKK